MLIPGVDVEAIFGGNAVGFSPTLVVFCILGGCVHFDFLSYFFGDGGDDYDNNNEDEDDHDGREDTMGRRGCLGEESNK